MREIKFRAWDTTKKDMIHLELRHVSPFAYHDFYKITQYIGIKDKNGVEIYEGDIIKADWRWTEPHRVVWPDDYYWLQECGLEGGNLEVIGNIYQHPELLR